MADVPPSVVIGDETDDSARERSGSDKMRSSLAMSKSPRGRGESVMYDNFKHSKEELGMTSAAASMRKNTVLPPSIEDEARMQQEYMGMLVNGREFVKYGRQGKPHSAFVCVSSDMLRFRWGVKTQMKSSPVAGKFEKTKALLMVSPGRGTMVFKRFANEREEACFSLVFNNQRTIDLELPLPATPASNQRELDNTERDLWVNAFKWLLAQNQRYAAKHTRANSGNLLPMSPMGAGAATDTSDYDELTSEELNKLFETFMEERCFKMSARATMVLLPDLKKKQLLAQEQFAGPNKDNPRAWITKIEPHAVTADILRELRVVIGGQGKKWMTEFVGTETDDDTSSMKKKDGLTSLLELLNPSHILPGCKMEILGCLKALMNNEFGLSLILGSAAAISTIAQVLAYGDDDMRLLVMELLTVTCWLSNTTGHGVVLKALGGRAFTKRFKVLVDMCSTAKVLGDKSVAVKTQTITFINILIATCDEIDLRVAIRQEFLDQGMMTNAMPGLLKTIDQNRGDKFVDTVQQLQWQCDFFMDQWQTDQRECTLTLLGDSTDPDAVYAFVRQTAGEDGFTSHLLTSLHCLAAMTHNDMMVKHKMWDNIKFAIHYVTKNISEDDMSTLDLAMLKSILGDRDGNIDASTGATIIRLEKEAEIQRRKLHNLQMERDYFEDQTKKLQASYQELLTKFNAVSAMKVGTGKGDYSGGDISGILPPPPGLDNFSGAPAPPPAPGFEGAPAPPAPPGAPEAPEAPGAPDAPPGAPDAPDAPGAPPGPPGAPGAPGAPSFGGIFGFGSKKDYGLPPKKAIKPGAPMKQFFWNKVAEENVKETIWKDLTDEGVAFDTKLFEERFATKPPKTKEGKVKENEAPEEEKKKVELVSIIDGKRAYNISIALSRFRMANEAIRDAIMALDPVVLDDERANTLLNCMPTPEEVEQVKGYGGDPELLGKAEAFFRAIVTIPRPLARLELYCFKLKYPTALAEIQANLNNCERSIKGIRSSKGLRKIFEIVLALGNYLNGGTKNGQAYGFKLDTLNKLVNTKSRDGKQNLMHFLVDLTETRFPDAKGFLSDLSTLPSAARIESAILGAEIGKFNASVKALGAELKTASDSIGDAFVRTMRDFYNSAALESESLTNRLSKLNSDAAAVSKLFGEEENTKFEVLFAMFNEFRNNFEETMGQLHAAKLAQEKEAEREARKNLPREAKAIVSDAKDESGASVVDKVMTNISKGDSQSLAKMVRDRRKKGKVETKTEAKVEVKMEVRAEPRAEPRAETKAETKAEPLMIASVARTPSSSTLSRSPTTSTRSIAAKIPPPTSAVLPQTPPRNNAPSASSSPASNNSNEQVNQRPTSATRSASHAKIPPPDGKTSARIPFPDSKLAPVVLVIAPDSPSGTENPPPRVTSGIPRAGGSPGTRSPSSRIPPPPPAGSVSPDTRNRNATLM